MTSLNRSIFSESERAIDNYETALNEFEQATPESSVQQVLKILLARDAVAIALDRKDQPFVSNLGKLLGLDGRLKKHGDAIASIGKLDEWRTSFNPLETAWWWFFQPPQEVHPWDRFDGVWNGLSVLSLTAFVAYMTSLVPLFAIGGFTVLESFGLIGPSGLMALALSSLRGGAGQKFIQNSMKKAGIPAHLHSEVTFALSALLLTSAIFTQANLSKIADYYYQQGRKHYNRGLLRKAESYYKQAINLDPENKNSHIALGEVYESLGELKEAEKHYFESVEEGLPRAFNNLGRVYRQKGDPVTAESMFRIGLSRIENSKDEDTKFQLHRNLGWALFDQKEYDEAIKELKIAIELDEKIPEKQIGGGMEYCLLAKTFEIKNEKQKADQNWNHCRQSARPETIREFQWLVEAGKRDVASSVDTTSVVGSDQ